MAAFPEKYLWPLAGVIVFAILAAFYYDDRRRLVQEEVASVEKTSSDTPAEYSDASAPSKPAETASKKPASKLYEYETAVTEHRGFSGSIEDYLSEQSAKRDAKLLAAANEHSGYSGSIDEYLGTFKPTHTDTTPTSTATYSHHSVDGTQATSMTMEEYLAKTGSGESSPTSKEGKQTHIQNKSDDPFNKEDHQGFHGSYEEYAKKYN